MVSELRKQSMAWMETDYSKHTLNWRLEHLGALGIMGEAAPYHADQQQACYLGNPWILAME